jgi:hypothetical protein
MGKTKRSLTWTDKNARAKITIWLPNEIIEYILSFISVEEHLHFKLVCKNWNNYFKTHIKNYVTIHPNKILKYYPLLETITVNYDKMRRSEYNITYGNNPCLKNIVLYNFDYGNILFHKLGIFKHKINLYLNSERYNGTCLKPIFDQIIDQEFVHTLEIQNKSSFCGHCQVLYGIIPVKELYIKHANGFAKSLLKNIIRNKNIEVLHLENVEFGNLPLQYYNKLLRMPELKKLFIDKRMLTDYEIEYFEKYKSEDEKDKSIKITLI